MTPTTASFEAYACAFVEHLPESHLPACAVASSHDWKATLWSPALKFDCSSRNRIASTIWMVCVRDEPWSGKSDAIRTLGSPSPSYSIAVQEDEGSGVMSPVPPPPPLASVVSPPPPASSSSSPPHPAASSASTATSRARTANKLCFLEINCVPPPSH